jgi:hypothetical protein
MRFLLILIAATGVAHAQTVYKCTDADGSPVFSQNPCGNDAQVIEVKTVAPPEDQLLAAGEEAQARSTIRALDLQENECVRRAERAAHSASGRRVYQYQKRIAALEARIARAANNFAGATWEAGMREEIAGLHQSIATERAGADAVVASAITRCAEARRRDEDRLQDEG